MEIEREEQWAARAYGPPHMRMIELPVSAVIVEPLFNCRAPYTSEEIEEACGAFEQQPMLHAPTVARVSGEWRLVAGFLRFAVWQAKGTGLGVFRWIEADDLRELAMANLAENLARRDLRPHEIVESMTRLRESGLSAKEIGARCRRTGRWVRRVCALKRDAHPELWEAFVAQRSPHLTLTRTLDLADHYSPEEQVRRLRLMLKSAEAADEHARGYREELPDAPPRGKVPAPTRRRYPVRRRAERVRRVIEREPSLDGPYRQGLLDAFRWFLSGRELPFQVSVEALGRGGRAAERDASGAADPGGDGDTDDRAAE